MLRLCTEIAFTRKPFKKPLQIIMMRFDVSDNLSMLFYFIGSFAKRSIGVLRGVSKGVEVGRRPPALQAGYP
jgi:hypothetical protein